MNKMQSFGVALIVTGFLLFLVFPVAGLLFGEQIIGISIAVGWIIAIIGAAIALISLVLERFSDMKKEDFKKY